MMNRPGAGQFSPPPPPPPEAPQFDIKSEAAKNEAWEEAALMDTIAVFDAATAEEVRRRQTEEMVERWHAERHLLHMERHLQHHERMEAIEQRWREAVERQQR
jgi:hypothetical protein